MRSAGKPPAHLLCPYAFRSYASTAVCAAALLAGLPQACAVGRASRGWLPPHSLAPRLSLPHGWIPLRRCWTAALGRESRWQAMWGAGTMLTWMCWQPGTAGCTVPPPRFGVTTGCRRLTALTSRGPCFWILPCIAIYALLCQGIINAQIVATGAQRRFATANEEAAAASLAMRFWKTNRQLLATLLHALLSFSSMVDEHTIGSVNVGL